MKLGELLVDVISDGEFGLDGGAMFGVVPKVIWANLIQADDLNRIRLALNCLLIRGEKTILVDTGVGDKFDSKLKSRYGIEKPTKLIASLNMLGVSVKDIDYVISTHLHFDHAGGNTILQGGKITQTFPNAKYLVQEKEWQDAVEPNERSRASYLPENFMQLEKEGSLQRIKGDRNIIKGVNVKLTGGHTAGHQIVEINSGGAVYFADIIPTASHLKLPYVTGYDLFPLETIKVKKELINSAIANKSLCFWEHDIKVPSGYLNAKGDKIEVITHG